MTCTPTDERIQHRRTHERLSPDITADPIFLFQRRRVWVAMGPYDYDIDSEHYYNDDGPIAEQTLIEEGYALEWWETESVFLTREDGTAYGEARAYNYPDGWRVYCVCARGDIVHVLAEATVGGRYR